MKRVIAAIDNSAAARPVLAMAEAVAKALAGTRDAVHVIEDGKETARASAEVAGARLRMLSGDPVEQLTRAVSDEGVVALVLGARGSPGGPRPAGHLALALAGVTDKPVVVVQPDADPPTTLRRVLIAMEGSPGKARALKRTIRLATDARLEIVVVHVDEEIPSFTDQIQHETTAHASAFLAKHVLDAPLAQLDLRIGVPAAQVLSAIDEFHPDLVSVGWPQADDPSRGAVAREILDRSPVPVLLVAVQSPGSG
jgi:nucleotide-binding universal stress UspA family protein